MGPAGEQVGIVRIEDALRLAAESDLDLVEVAPMAKPPVAKLMDFGKYKYEAAVKAREARKNQTNTVLKEIRFRLKIDTHDYETKTGHALRFLGAGDKVKAMIQFRGREQQRPEMGIRLLQKFAQDVASVGTVESAPRIDGRNMVMVIGPLKNKAEAKAEARRAAQRAEAKAANEAKRIQTDSAEPISQSLGENAALKEAAAKAEAAQKAQAEAASVADEAPAAPTAVEDSSSAGEAAEQAPETKVEAEPKAAAAKPAAKAPAKATAKPAPAKAASKPAAPKPAAKAPAAKAAAKPAAPKPAATKAAAKPAAPKPAAKPKKD